MIGREKYTRKAFETWADKENRLRKEFEVWAGSGSRNLFYNLQKAANDQYFSPFTEQAWRAFKAGWEAR